MNDQTACVGVPWHPLGAASSAGGVLMMDAEDADHSKLLQHGAEQWDSHRRAVLRRRVDRQRVADGASPEITAMRPLRHLASQSLR